jgi:hypothetical protein
MTINHASPHATDDLQACVIGSVAGSASRDVVGRLFAAALDGDRRAGAALHLLGGFDDIANRASWALLRGGQDHAEPIPPDVLAGIDRTLAALRNRRRQS